MAAMTPTKLLALALLLAPAAAGCVGVPFASPPAQLSVGTGARLEPESADAPARVDVPLQFRVGVHPLAFTSELAARRADFGFGYQLLNGGDGRVHGLYFEASGVMLAGPVGAGWGKLSARLHGQLLTRDSFGSFGEGGALQLTAELADRADGPFDSHDAEGGTVGYAFGEQAIGCYLEGGWYVLGGRQAWTATTGLLVRLPASAGLVWKWLWAI
jgi:hypothetical protein